MPEFTQMVTWEVLGILFVLFALVCSQMLTGEIGLHGLLMRKEGDRLFSPERVQLLLATLAMSFQYLSRVFEDPTHFPQLPQNWLLLFGASHALYLGRRFYLSRSAKQKGS